MAKLTESYLRNMIKQVMNEAVSDDYNKGYLSDEQELNTQLSSYEIDGMATKADVIRAINDLEGSLNQAPDHMQDQLRRLLKYANQIIQMDFNPGGSGAADPHLRYGMDESRRRRMAPKRR